MWIKPKTDWKETDFFNIQDYNRIKGNLEEIRMQALGMYPDFFFEDMGEEKGYTDYFYADEINKFESNLEHIMAGSFPLEIGESQRFFDNQPFIDAKELNRIERACLLLYLNLSGQRAGIRRLSFTLGNRRQPQC